MTNPKFRADINQIGEGISFRLQEQKIPLENALRSLYTANAVDTGELSIGDMKDILRK